MKDKILKILSKAINVILEVILIISSLPFIGVFLWAIYNSIFGMDSMQTEIYGLNAFGMTIVASFFMFVPVVQICLIYQLFYLIRYIVKENKKDKALKIIFILSIFFLFFSSGPVLLICIAYQIFYSICHIVKKTKKDKILNIIYIFSLILSFFSTGPVLLVCRAYQFFYLTRHFIKKHKSKNVGVGIPDDPK